MITRKWTFGQRVGAGFATMIVLTLLTGSVGAWAVESVASSKDVVIAASVEQMVNAERLRRAANETMAAYRAFLLTGENRFLDDVRASRAEFGSALGQLRDNGAGIERRRLLDEVERAELAHQEERDQLIAQRQAGVPTNQIARAFDNQASTRAVLKDTIATLATELERELAARRVAASERSTEALVIVLVIALLTIGFGVLTAVTLTRTMKREVARAVGQIQSSSAELEVAALQQVNGVREQSTAMSEITTTTNELLITSRQIVDSAQRVSRIAEETAEAARSGDATIEQTRASIAAIRRQVDLIVQHMLELGERSQQIGGIVDLVSELAEQTNILAINATIEASGAGEWGRRFAVVADEIRKLADRTAGSAKEIRALVDDVRGAVNTTVMATETGAKAVDAGAQRFDEVTQSFRRIASLVGTTADAAREIELSTKQQTSAVEQATAAVTDTARVARETEASSTQTRQTASHLAELSTSLLQLVNTKAA
jgi:methyl-accepting chemotaxis protein